jgi:hypothetical protein
MNAQAALQNEEFVVYVKRTNIMKKLADQFAVDLRTISDFLAGPGSKSILSELVRSNSSEDDIVKSIQDSYIIDRYAFLHCMKQGIDPKDPIIVKQYILLHLPLSKGMQDSIFKEMNQQIGPVGFQVKTKAKEIKALEERLKLSKIESTMDVATYITLLSKFQDFLVDLQAEKNTIFKAPDWSHLESLISTVDGLIDEVNILGQYTDLALKKREQLEKHMTLEQYNAFKSHLKTSQDKLKEVELQCELNEQQTNYKQLVRKYETIKDILITMESDIFFTLFS